MYPGFKERRGALGLLWSSKGQRCACGCGKVTSVAEFTRPSRGEVQGEHRMFVRGHNIGTGGKCQTKEPAQ